MNPVIKSEKDGRIEIIQRGSGLKLEPLFFKAIQEANDAGYRLAENPKLLTDLPSRNHQSTMMGKWVGYKEGYAPKDKVAEKVETVKPEPTPTPEVTEEVKPEKKEKKAGRPKKQK